MKVSSKVKMALVAAMVLGMSAAISAAPNFGGTYPPILDKLNGEATGISGSQASFVWTGEKLSAPIAVPVLAIAGGDLNPVGYEVVPYDFSQGRSAAF
jgi:hypothetical protein